MVNRTPYSSENQLFTDDAHIAAQSLIYPILFNTPYQDLGFETTSLGMGVRERVMDGEMAIDRIIKVNKKWFNASIEFTVQERFRRADFVDYQDVTITEWNVASNMKGELYKLYAGIFIYGYFDQQNKDFVDWIAVNTNTLLRRLVIREPRLQLSHNPRSLQTFYTFKFSDLHKAGCVLASKKLCKEHE